MTKHDESFPPEAVDEQIERPRDLLPAEDARLISALHQTYRSYANANERSLDYVWGRIQQRRQQALPYQDARPLPDKPASMQRERNDSMHITPSRSGKRSGISRQLSLIAAVVFVALLVGSMAVVFNLAAQKGKSPTTTAGQSPNAPAATPKPTWMASPAVPGIYISSMKDWNTYQVSRLDKNTHAVVWSHDVGEITSSIVVVGGTVYVSASDGPDLRDNYVYALDAATGAVRWRADLISHYGQSAPLPTPQPTSIPSPTPVANGNATPSPFFTPTPIVNGNSANLIYPGSLTTPAVAGDAVYVIARDGTVYALNGGDGSVLWSHNTGQIGSVDGTIYDPGDVAVANGIVYATIHNGLFAIDAKSGKALWSKQTDTEQIFTSPLVVGNAVYLSSYEVSHHHGGQTQTGAVYSYDAKNGKANWKHAVDNWVLSTPTVVNDMVYFGSYNTSIYALQASTGAEVWHYTTGGHVFDSPLVSNGVVYAQASGNSDEGSLAPSTIKPTLYALDATHGTKLWSRQIDAGLQTIQDGVLYVGVFPRALYALKASDGSTIWHQQYGTDLIDKTGAHNGPPPEVAVVP